MTDINFSETIDCDKLLDSLSSEMIRLDLFLMDRKFPSNDYVKRYALCYAAQCVDFSKALLLLQSKESTISQYAIWRSLFEAYVRFSYLMVTGKNCREVQIQRLRNLQLDAYKDELRGINDPELDLEIKVERRSWLEQQINALKSDGAQSKSIEAMLKEMTGADHTNGWYPFFRMCSAKVHSRLTDFDRVYGHGGTDLRFPATQSPEECHFLFGNAKKFLFEVGSGVATLWGEEISVT